MRTARLILVLALCMSAPAFAAKKKKPPAPPPPLEQPALAQPDLSGADPHWIHDAKSDCWAYFPDQPAALTFTWTGGCKDHVIDGRGTLTWSYVGGVERVVDGEFKLGRGNGAGRIRYANGDVYEGNLRDGLKEGRGVLVYDGGTDRYEGGFHQNYFDGQGTRTLPNGDTITGTFHQGMNQGAVLYRQASGGRGFKGEIVLPHADRTLPAVGLAYPQMSIRLNEEGSTVVACIVGADGTQRDIHITLSSGFPRLDQAALDYVTALHVLPGTVGGAPIAMSYVRSIRFRIPR